MNERLFVGVRISRNLEKQLDNPAPGTEGYLQLDNVNYLQIVTRGQERLIGCHVKSGSTVVEVENLSRQVSESLKLIIPGHRVSEHSVCIYAFGDSEPTDFRA